MRRSGELPVVVCFDAEPDARTPDPENPGGLEGFERLLELVPGIRERLAELTGSPVAFTWTARMDPQIEAVYGSATWIADTWSESFEALAREGDEIGIHSHDWRWVEERGDWVANNDDAAWEAHVAEQAVDAYRRAFGRAPRTHRGGSHLLTPAMLGALAAGGIEVDLTPEAGLPPTDHGWEGETFLGASPDWRVIPSTPYRTSAEAFPGADPGSDQAPLMMPLTAAPNRNGRRFPLTLWSPPLGFAGRLALQTLRSPLPQLSFAVRSNSPLFEQKWSRILANLDHVASLRGARFVTALEAARPYMNRD